MPYQFVRPSLDPAAAATAAGAAQTQLLGGPRLPGSCCRLDSCCCCRPSCFSASCCPLCFDKNWPGNGGLGGRGRRRGRRWPIPAVALACCCSCWCSCSSTLVTVSRARRAFWGESCHFRFWESTKNYLASCLLLEVSGRFQDGNTSSRTNWSQATWAQPVSGWIKLSVGKDHFDKVTFFWNVQPSNLFIR